MGHHLEHLNSLYLSVPEHSSLASIFRAVKRVADRDRAQALVDLHAVDLRTQRLLEAYEAREERERAEGVRTRIEPPYTLSEDERSVGLAAGAGARGAAGLSARRMRMYALAN